MLKVQRNSKGFTLIELLIVIAIIGILAAVAIPAYTGYTKRAKAQEVIHAMGAVKTAVMAYYSEANQGPVDADSIANITDKLGVTVPDKYLTSMAVDTSGNGVITAVFNDQIGADLNNKDLVLTPSGSNWNTWSWSGSLPDAYKPKSR